MCVCEFQFPLNKLTDQIRIELAEAGFTEALTFSLVYKKKFILLALVSLILRILITLFYSVLVKM